MQGYETEKTFEPPAEAFDEQGNAHFTVSGGSAGTWWRLAIFSRHLPVDERHAIGIIGFNLDEERRPDLASEVAKQWVEDLGLSHEFVVAKIEDESRAWEAPFSISYHFTVYRVV